MDAPDADKVWRPARTSPSLAERLDSTPNEFSAICVVETEQAFRDRMCRARQLLHDNDVVTIELSTSPPPLSCTFHIKRGHCHGALIDYVYTNFYAHTVTEPEHTGIGTKVVVTYRGAPFCPGDLARVIFDQRYSVYINQLLAFAKLHSDQRFKDKVTRLAYDLSKHFGEVLDATISPQRFQVRCNTQAALAMRKVLCAYFGPDSIGRVGRSMGSSIFTVLNN